MSTDAPRDGNFVPAALFEIDGSNREFMPGQIDQATGRILTTVAGGTGTVTSVSVVSANGFAGTVATATTTPAITLSTTITGFLQGNGTAISAATTTGSGSTLVLATAPTFPTTITVGAALGATGQILLKGVTSGTITMKPADAAGTWILTLPTTDGNAGEFLQTDGNGVTTWAASGGTGTVTSVSVVSANGFTGTVANATTTPAITLTTSITGVLKGNGTAISAATAGSDYAVGSLGLAGGQTIAGSTLTNENLTLRANAADLTTGQINITSSKEASNTTTGAVAIAGGLAVAKRVYALDMTVTNTITGSISGNAGTASAVAVGGITGLGTGVATALAVNIGSAGAFVTFNGALGTPSSGTLTNATGLPAAAVVAGTLGTGAYIMDTSLAVPQIFNADHAIAASSNAATVTRAYRNNVVTNNSAATLTITMSTTSAAAGDMLVVQILDASGVAQTIAWVNTENSTVTAPTTSNGSTTLPLTVGFKWNSATSKWRCIASA